MDTMAAVEGFGFEGHNDDNPLQHNQEFDGWGLLCRIACHSTRKANLMRPIRTGEGDSRSPIRRTSRQRTSRS